MMRVYPCEDPNAKKDKNYLKVFNKTINQASDQILDKISQKT